MNFIVIFKLHILSDIEPQQYVFIILKWYYIIEHTFIINRQVVTSSPGLLSASDIYLVKDLYLKSKNISILMHDCMSNFGKWELPVPSHDATLVNLAKAHSGITEMADSVMLMT